MSQVRILTLLICLTPLWLLPVDSAAQPVAPAVDLAPATEPAAEPAFAIPATDEGLPGVGPIRRMEWFQKLWRQRRSAWAKKVERDQGALVFFGDSITQGWGKRLGAAFAGVKVANRGISGDTTRGMLIRLEDDVLSLRPSGVVMLMGTNDLEEHADPKAVAHNVVLILESLADHNPDMPIVVCRVMPSSSSKSRPADKIREVNRLVEEAVRQNQQVTVLDTWTLFADKSGDAKVEEFPDLLHPNDAGYAKWEAALRPLLATLGFLENAPDDFTPEPGFESLFNGRDLTGWQLRPTPPRDLASRKNWHANDPNAPPWPVIEEPVLLEGKKISPSGRYVAINGRLVVTTPSEGRKIEQLWTTQQFPDDFVLKLEFRATPNTDSGVYVRGPQLQCRDFPLAGPYKHLQSYKPQEWNEMVVAVTGGVAHCTCNGEVLEESMAVPATGPIGLEGDRGQMEYRRIRIKKL